MILKNSNVYHQYTLPNLIQKIESNDIETFELPPFLSSEKKSELLDKIIKNTSLKSLKIFIKPTEKDDIKISEILNSHESITNFCFFGDQKIENISKSIFQQGFEKNLKLEVLEVKSYQLLQNGLDILNQFLLNNQNLLSLKLNNNWIDKDDYKFIAQGIKNSKSLTELSIIDNEFYKSPSLIDALINNDSITKLNISNVKLRHPATQQLHKMKKLRIFIASYLGRAYSESDEMKYLINSFNGMRLNEIDLCGQDIDDINGALLMKEFKDMDIKVINLDQNKIGVETCKVLSELLKTKNLISLSLVDNRLTGKCSNLLSDGVMKSKSITNLQFTILDDLNEVDYFDIGNNQTLKSLSITSQVNCILYFQKIFSNLSKNNSLTSLYFQADLSMLNPEIIFDYFKNNKSLTAFSSYKSDFDDLQIQNLCEALSENYTLKNLVILQSKITKQGLVHIQNLYKKNKALTSFMISSQNYFKSSDIFILEDMISNLEKFGLFTDYIIDKKEEERFKNLIFYNYNLNHLTVNFSPFENEFIIMRNKSFIKVPYKINHYKDINFMFSNASSGLLEEQESKKRKINENN